MNAITNKDNVSLGTDAVRVLRFKFNFFNNPLKPEFEESGGVRVAFTLNRISKNQGGHYEEVAYIDTVALLVCFRRVSYGCERDYGRSVE